MVGSITVGRLVGTVRVGRGPMVESNVVGVVDGVVVTGTVVVAAVLVVVVSIVVTVAGTVVAVVAVVGTVVVVFGASPEAGVEVVVESSVVVDEASVVSENLALLRPRDVPSVWGAAWPVDVDVDSDDSPSRVTGSRPTEPSRLRMTRLTMTTTMANKTATMEWRCSLARRGSIPGRLTFNWGGIFVHARPPWAYRPPTHLQPTAAGGFQIGIRALFQRLCR
jgi:hypothetical protein